MSVVHSPSLQHAIFPITDDRVTNSSLLELHACNGNFLSSCVLPNLISITVQPHFDDSVAMIYECSLNALWGLHELILASRCPLHQLYLTSIDYGDDNLLLSILTLTPHLKELVVMQDFEANTTMVAVLHSLFSHLQDNVKYQDKTHRSALLPNLSKLSITLACTFPTLDLHVISDPFVGMVTACWNGYENLILRMVTLTASCSTTVGAPINHFEAKNIFIFTAGHIRRLKEWQREGLHIDINVHDLDTVGPAIDVLDTGSG
ncbi:hypothetical protein EV421DRAFT_1905942 [Armillaria borealis]|uniref:Uncharacterized protein n=1 Tax=Armillaria borealis TaxID=47425 RepID=A0AA39JCV8_9AGAR|nr:hypothetical protein EV421DRAFT_1905942 [Armillaria borealis]